MWIHFLAFVFCAVSLPEDSKRSGFMDEVVRKRNKHCGRPSDVPLDLLVELTIPTLQ